MSKLSIKTLKNPFKTEDNVLQVDKLFFLHQKWQTIITMLEMRLISII